MTKTDLESPIEAFTRTGIDAARQWLDTIETMSRTLAANNSLLTGAGSSCCDIPPPCWMPRHIGDFHSAACPCGTALLRVHVKNCQPRSERIDIAVKSEQELEVKIVPESATVGPMQSKTFTLAVTIPEDVCPNDIFDLVVWVAGCNDYYGHWRVRVADGASGSCQEVHVEDCPDYVHHWYDHFYCARPCFSGQTGRK